MYAPFGFSFSIASDRHDSAIQHYLVHILIRTNCPDQSRSNEVENIFPVRRLSCELKQQHRVRTIGEELANVPCNAAAILAAATESVSAHKSAWGRISAIIASFIRCSIINQWPIFCCCFCRFAFMEWMGQRFG